MEEKEKEIIEIMARIEHERWASWQEHIFDCAVKSGDDNIKYRTFGYPTEQVERWQKQIDTPYEELSEEDKEKDRNEVRKTLKALEKEGFEII